MLSLGPRSSQSARGKGFLGLGARLIELLQILYLPNKKGLFSLTFCSVRRVTGINAH